MKKYTNKLGFVLVIYAKKEALKIRTSQCICIIPIFLTVLSFDTLYQWLQSILDVHPR